MRMCDASTNLVKARVCCHFMRAKHQARCQGVLFSINGRFAEIDCPTSVWLGFLVHVKTQHVESVNCTKATAWKSILRIAVHIEDQFLGILPRTFRSCACSTPELGMLDAVWGGHMRPARTIHEWIRVDPISQACRCNPCESIKKCCKWCPRHGDEDQYRHRNEGNDDGVRTGRRICYPTAVQRWCRPFGVLRRAHLFSRSTWTREIGSIAHGQMDQQKSRIDNFCTV